MYSYSCKGYPSNNSLSENRVLIRSHKNKKVIDLMERWWNEINCWTLRDQLSLCYVAWELKIEIGLIFENPRFENEYFKWYPHRGYSVKLFDRLMKKVKNRINFILIYPLFIYKVRILGTINYFWSCKKKSDIS